VYARLLALLSEQLDRGLEDSLRRAWATRSFGAWYERPLLLLAALRDAALGEGPSHPLWNAVAADAPRAESASTSAIAAAVAPDREALWRTLAERHVQTNETSRAVGWMWPAHLLAGAPRPIALLDIGASAGLNLVADQLAPMWERADGTALPVAPLPPIASRTGYDLRPIDVRDPDEVRWLLACTWPEQQGRVHRLRAAVDAVLEMAARGEGPVLEQVTAAEIPARLPTCAPGTLAIAYQSVFRDYLSADERARYEEGMHRWLLRCPPGAALWVELEPTVAAAAGGPAAAITAHVHAAGAGLRSFELAHCEPHPRTLHVRERAARALVAAMHRSA
jgi:hypothetical protein